MDSVAIVASFTTIFRSYKNLYSSLSRIAVFRQHYGMLRACILYLFACDAWRIETELLLSGSDKDAEAFRKTQENECAMTAIVGSILAQMNITAVQIDYPEQVPWYVGVLWMSSFVSSLVAVFYSSKQLKVIGRLLRPEQIRAWVRCKGEGQKQRAPGSSSDAQFVLPAFTSVFLIASPGLMLGSAVDGFLLGIVGRFSVAAAAAPPGPDKDSLRNTVIVYVAVIVMSYLVYGQVGLVHATEGGDSALEAVLVALRERVDTATDMEATPASASTGSSDSRENTIAVEILPPAVGEELTPSSVLALQQAARQCQECASALQQVAEYFDGTLTRKKEVPSAPAPD